MEVYVLSRICRVILLPVRMLPRASFYKGLPTERLLLLQFMTGHQGHMLCSQYNSPLRSLTLTLSLGETTGLDQQKYSA